ncbi:MAG: hypothetical protein MHM6MM_001357 [Cercozoa sp. M6MM]
MSVWAALRSGPLKVCVIGSGNWGSCIAKIVGENVKRSYLFNDRVPMWVHEEMVNGRKLTEQINELHENIKYLPGIKLPENVVAEPDLLAAVRDANLLVFVLPHQFLPNVCRQLRGHLSPTCSGITLVKGFLVEDGKPILCSQFIERELGISMAALAGANVARPIALGEFAESTIGYPQGRDDAAAYLQQLFDTPYFRVDAVPDVAGVEVCGALKNVVALGVGFADGLGFGSNTRASLMRIGFSEIRKFAQRFLGNCQEQTFWESAGMADLITTCLAGRNHRCAMAFAEQTKQGATPSWQQIEADLLKGQKLQGTGTAKEVMQVLTAQDAVTDFPFMSQVYKIAFDNAPVRSIVEVFMHAEPRPLRPSTPQAAL